MALISILSEILQRPTIGGVLGELMLFVSPVWIAVIIGVLVGWAWKPKWANLGKDFLDCPKENSSESPMSSCISRSSIPSLISSKLQQTSFISSIANDGAEKEASVVPPMTSSNCRFVLNYCLACVVARFLSKYSVAFEV